jgi:hypothetical protein
MASTLLAVYADRDRAQEAVEALRRRPSGGQVVVDDPDDARAAVQAEMQAEVADSWASPGVGALVTKEMMRGALLMMVVVGISGLLIGALLGWLAFEPGWSLGFRLLLGAGIGGVFGGTVGALVGGGLGVRPPDEPLAGEQGVPVRVDHADPEALAVLRRFKPLRIDEIVDSERRTTPESEGPGNLVEGVAETAQQISESARDPSKR